MIFQKILLSLIVVIISAGMVFANVQENQQKINENFSNISSREIPEAARSEFNALPSNVEIPEGATFGEYQTLVQDGIDGPITRAALDEIDVVTGASPDDGFVNTPPSTTQPSVQQNQTPQNAWNQGSSEPKPCKFDVDEWVQDIAGALDDCLEWSNLVNAKGKIKVEEGMKNQILDWTLSLAQLLSLLAVWAIVYGGLLMTLSGGEEEKIKKGKDVIKWAIIWFLGVLFAGVLVRVVVELIFTIATVAS